MESWTERKECYRAVISLVEPCALITTKDHILWRVLWWVPTILTFGLFSLWLPLPIFLTEKATTIGPVHGYPRQWNRLSKKILIHEGRHTWHMVQLGWLVPIIGWFFGRRVRAYAGVIPYAVFYVFVIFPAGLALGRLLCEVDCEYQTYKFMIRYGYGPKAVIARAEREARYVCGKHYAFSWPYRLGGRMLFIRAAEKAIEQWMR